MITQETVHREMCEESSIVYSQNDGLGAVSLLLTTDHTSLKIHSSTLLPLGPNELKIGIEFKDSRSLTTTQKAKRFSHFLNTSNYLLQ